MNSKKIKHLLIAIGPGYHTSVRILHSIVSDISNGKLLLFDIYNEIEHIDDDLLIKDYYSFSNLNNTYNLFRVFLSDNKFDLIGISFMSFQWDVFKKISEIIREELPNCKIIAGGVHPWHIDPIGTLDYCDYVCANEGELVYYELVTKLNKNFNQQPLIIPGLYEKVDQEIIFTPSKELIMVDEIPFPTIGTNDVYHLHSIGDNPSINNFDPLVKSNSAYIHIGRGCFFNCSYCINSLKSSHSVRIRTVDKVINEILYWLEKCDKIKTIYFMDEIFPLKKSWLIEFAEKYRDISLPFQITLYPGFLTNEKLKILKKAGLNEISIGIQSGSYQIREKVYKRPGSNEKIIKENEILSKCNIMTYYDFIIKNPYENEKDYNETLSLIKKLKKPFYLKFYTLSFYPNHPLTIQALNDNMIDTNSISPKIAYLDVTTPHKIAIIDHRFLERQLIIWNKVLKNNIKKGSIEDLYILLSSFYGYSFVPKALLKLLYTKNNKPNLKRLIYLTDFINFILYIRSSKFILFLHNTIIYTKNNGLYSLITEISKRISIMTFYQNHKK